MLLTDKTEVIIKGTLSFNENVKFTIFKFDEDDRYSFINIDDGNNHAENSFYDVELLNLLKAINNNDFEALKKINKDIEETIRSFYNYTFLNKGIIKKACNILNITLGNHEKELYNQDFMDTKDDLFNFNEKTFKNNWFYCLKNLKLENLTEEEIVQKIVQYYMKIFISCCVECQSEVADLY